MEYLLFASVSGMVAAMIAHSRGSSIYIWFFLGAMIPVLGPIMAGLYRREEDEVRRECPGCGKIVPLHDALCTRCGTELEFPDIAIEPVSTTRSRAAHLE